MVTPLVPNLGTPPAEGQHHRDTRDLSLSETNRATSLARIDHPELQNEMGHPITRHRRALCKEMLITDRRHKGDAQVSLADYEGTASLGSVPTEPLLYRGVFDTRKLGVFRNAARAAYHALAGTAEMTHACDDIGFVKDYLSP
jgi:hypothetical protein